MHKAESVGKIKGYARLVLLHMPSDMKGEAEVSREEMASLTGLTVNQVGAAIAYIRDNNPGLSLITTSDGYLYTKDPDLLQYYQHTRAKTARTIIRRTWTGAIEPWLKNLDPNVAKIVAMQYKYLMEEIELVIQ